MMVEGLVAGRVRRAVCDRWWFYLGWPAFIGVLLAFYLMVMKPAHTHYLTRVTLPTRVAD